MFSEEVINTLRAFNDSGVKYTVVGGIAVVAYGHDRTTGDLNLWLDNDESNLLALENALLSCEFKEEQIKAAIASYREKSHLTITMDEWLPFDLMPVYSSYVTFEKAFDSGTKTNLFGVDLVIVDLHTLIDMKLRAGREKDFRDVQALKNIHHLD